MDIDYIIKGLILISISIIGFVLKTFYGSFVKLSDKVDGQISKFREETGKLKGRVELLDQKMPSEITHLENKMDLKLSSFEDKITDMKNTMEHMDKNISIMSEAFVKMIDKK